MAKILIVEDESILAMSIRIKLEKMGHEVVGIADDSETALGLLEQGKPDLILMDIVLHGDIDGTELTSIVNKKYGIPVIYGTAHTDEATIKNVNQTRHFGILYKPYNVQDLTEAINKVPI